MSPYRKRSYYVPSPCKLIDRLKAVAIGLQERGGVVMPAFFALDSLDMLRW